MSFKSWSDTNKKKDYPYYLSYEDYVMLNLLSPTYHSGTGYTLGTQYACTDDTITPFMVTSFPGLIDINNDNNDIEYEVKIDTDKAKFLACNYKLKHKTIIVRLRARGELSWYDKPAKTNMTSDNKILPKPLYWYELPATNKMLGPLSTKPYIHVVDLFEEIELRSAEKGSPLTIDDVLFACRGLSADGSRSVDKFTVLSDNGSEILLMADIDNYST